MHSRSEHSSTSQVFAYGEGDAKISRNLALTGVELFGLLISHTNKVAQQKSACNGPIFHWLIYKNRGNSECAMKASQE